MTCRICEKESVDLLIDFGMQPIVHAYLKSSDEKYPLYPCKLGYCKSCSFLQLMETISPDILYKNYFTVSEWKNQPHIPHLINIIKSINGFDQKDSLLDIGCNDGSFLVSMSKSGYKNIYGIEPTLDSYKIANDKGLNVHHGFFEERVAFDQYGKNRFDIITARQVLEHISNLDDFMKGISLVIKDDGCLIIEIPDSDWTYEYFDYALWEEHVNYFTINTIKNLMRKYSFDVIHHETTLFSGKALTVFCKKNRYLSGNLNCNTNDLNNAHRYKQYWPKFVENLKYFIESKATPVAIYGCGARSSNFVNFSGVSNMIECFIDDQPEKQKLYVPGCELKINRWEDECFKQHNILLGVNTENEYKVINKRNLDIGKTYSILPPSQYLPDFWKKDIRGFSND